MQEYFKMGGSIDKKLSFVISIVGLFVFLLIWYIITQYGLVPQKILPNPVSVLQSYPDLISKNDLFGNVWYSIELNIVGYVKALCIAIPLGFVIGLYALPRALFGQYIDAARFLPLTAITGLFIVWFGIGFTMKVNFLAFGILIYILPVVVQTIQDLQNPANDKDYVYLQTIETLGATGLQKIRYVYIPYVMSRISDSIRVLTAISWTYIIIAELLNKEGGIGAMIYTLGRQSRTPEVFALLFLIILIGFLQDLFFRKLDVLLFPSKYGKSSFFTKKSSI